MKIASEFHEAIYAPVTEIQRAQRRWPEIEPGVRRYRIDRFNYNSVYRVFSDHVQIVAIAHLSREPRYWANRI